MLLWLIYCPLHLLKLEISVVIAIDLVIEKLVSGGSDDYRGICDKMAVEVKK